MIVNTRKKWHCKTCGKWMSGLKRESHVAQHSASAKLINSQRGIEKKLPSEKGRLKAQAKKRLILITFCSYCKKEGTENRGPDGLFWHMDHIVPWSVGQLESLENYVKSCHSCNTSKRDKVQYPDGYTMTAAGVLFRHTALFRSLIDSGEIRLVFSLSKES